jgi:hypothetical protein
VLFLVFVGVAQSCEDEQCTTLVGGLREEHVMANQNGDTKEMKK